MNSQSPGWRSLQLTLYAIFVLSTLGLALFALLAIWEVADLREAGKPIGTLGVVALASALLLSATRIVGCNTREDDRTP